MKKAHVVLSAILIALFTACSTASVSKRVSDYRVGDKVDYAKGSRFHIEIAVVDVTNQEDYKLVDAVMRNKDNKIMRMKRGNRKSYRTIPESRFYDIWTALEHLDLDFSSDVCTFDVTVRGINASRVGKSMILRRGMYLEDTMEPMILGPDTIQYQGLKIHQLASIVLPMGDGVWAKRPTLELLSKDCRIEPVGGLGNPQVAELKHRVWPNGQDDGPNSSIIVAVFKKSGR